MVHTTNGRETRADPAALDHAALDRVWIHMAAWADLAERDGLRVFARGDGARLYDTRGKEYLDGISGLWVVNAGHGRAEIGQAMAKQAAELAYVSAALYITPVGVALAEAIAARAPGDLGRVFFCSGGSEAVESAVKIAKQVQVMRGYPLRSKVIARRGSYHGATHGAASLSHWTEPYFGPPMPGVLHAPNPNGYRPNFPGLAGEADDLACADAVEQEILFQGAETVAAVVAEPISVANGVHVPAAAYWRRLREICDRHGVLLIADEVITGWGRTGRWFALEHFGVVPDLLTTAKGLSSGYAAIGAVVVRPAVFEGFKRQETTLNHLLTFGGQAVGCAAALTNIAILDREDLVQRSAEAGAYLLDLLDGLRDHPTVGDLRGVGLLCAVELVRDRATKERFGRGHPFLKRVAALLDERGVTTRVWDMLHLAPPLVVSTAELDRLVEAVDASLTRAEREFAAELG